MKAWVVSDLHRDYNGSFTLEPPSDAEIAIIAGDVCDDDWLTETARDLPVVFVAGNHEFYGWEYGERIESLFDLEYKGDIDFQLLNNDYSPFQREDLSWCHIAGATLWTDYDNNPVAAETARRTMNDHRRIKWTKQPYQRFLPSHATKLYRESLEYLRDSRADVIVTHHAPHRGSVHPRYDGQLLNYAYFSDALEKFEHPPRIWIHGHVHDSFDYMVGETRVICNPHGYGQENKRFDPRLIVDI